MCTTNLKLCFLSAKILAVWMLHLFEHSLCIFILRGTDTSACLLSALYNHRVESPSLTDAFLAVATVAVPRVDGRRRCFLQVGVQSHRYDMQLTVFLSAVLRRVRVSLTCDVRAAWTLASCMCNVRARTNDVCLLLTLFFLHFDIMGTMCFLSRWTTPLLFKDCDCARSMFPCSLWGSLCWRWPWVPDFQGRNVSALLASCVFAFK